MLLGLRMPGQYSWVLPGKPSWGCWGLSQPGTCLGQSLEAENSLEPMSDWNASHGRGWVPHLKGLRGCPNFEWQRNPPIPAEMPHHRLHMGYQVPDASAAWKLRQMLASKVSELLREQNQSSVVPGSFPTRTEYFISGDNSVWHEWQICFLFEGNKVHSQYFYFELQTYGDLQLMKAKRNYFKIMRVRAFWHSRMDCCCHHKLLHISVGWKGFHQDIHKTKGHHCKQQLGTWQWENLGAGRGYLCQTSSSDKILVVSICLSPVFLLHFPFIPLISLILGKVKFNNANL